VILSSFSLSTFVFLVVEFFLVVSFCVPVVDYHVGEHSIVGSDCVVPQTNTTGNMIHDATIQYLDFLGFPCSVC
jgi:hypothetical protein